MAVKKHELVHDNRNQLDLQALEQYIQLMIDQSNYMPAPHELVKNCQDIVKCLARASGNEEQMWNLIQTVEEYLLRIVNSVHTSLRHEIVTAILDKFYTFISDPQSDACPATSVVLIVLDSSDTEGNLSAARWLVQQGDNGPAGAGLRASLSCLYCWLHEWHLTPALGDWVFAFIKALEENERFDILIEVSVDNLGRLFLALDDPIALRQSVADVIFHVLASLRESTEAFDRIAPHVGRVLANLANDSGQWSRQLLQNVVDILTAAVDGYVDALKGEAQEMFKDKYSDVISCLERHMASHGCRYLQQSPWRARNVCLSGANTHASMQKVGLLNLGNTCYMNSVMQALLVTRQFSTHVMLKMNAVPYWSKMGVLFSKMMHSITTKLNPDEFFSVVKPPFFTRNNQHDSSEFLGYLFELLQSYEHCSDVNFDYSKPAVLSSHSRHRAVVAASQSTSADANDNVEPRPSSSGSSSSGQKRPSGDAENGPSKKRIRMAESTFLRRDSFIDSMFGGVLLTRVECTVCHSSSLSRDVFRDLQLAFPEKLDGWQHNVQSLLEYYCSKESLTGENRYRCRDCGVLRDAERSVLIETTPKYLILILKNFKTSFNRFDPKLQVQTKLMHSMYHNHNITLPTVRSQTVHASYSLYAAVIHDGTTLDSGHYYTLAKDNGQWHIYNDDTVTTSDEAELNGLNRSSTPYILFYRRTDIEEGTAPSMTELPPKVQELVMSHNKQYVEKVRTLRLTRP
ncbi:ubiquitin carboxyl-terminal hydrolase 35 isoform X2 [Helicoverpa armigera]|uniref:ubiquitin carboxyl-terminal hydrolase 35 isoform X2 n=1 Tax=Helicoverpa armigera TaxID=29058 RepID=UPI002112C86D|nr:ubiquitin carboxyl-terminal hydrolase 35 isoform X2 [Helicoverpa armigera]